MKQFIARSQKYGYSIYRINGNEYLYKVATFVVTENYKHHTESVTPSDMKCEIHSTYKEELLFNDCAQIYIAEDDCVYIIGNRDFDTLEKLENSSKNHGSLPAISRYRHTEPLKLEQSTKGVSDGDRSFVIDVSSKRREYANFNVSLSTASNGQLHLDISLVGRAQKKALWWGRDFNDEFVWAQFTCLGGSINDKIPFKGKTSVRIAGTDRVSESIPLGVSSHTQFIRTTVEFSFTKSTKRPNEFYSNKYYRSN